MKKFALVVAILFVAGLALAQAGEAVAAGKDHDVNAEVVSVDLAANTLTVKMGDDTKTVPAKDKAVEVLKSLKTGDKVVLTCHDSDDGKHESVVKIRRV